MAIVAKRYQGLIGILLGVSTELWVMNFKVGSHGTPVISPNIRS